MHEQLLELFDGLPDAHGEYLPTDRTSAKGKREGKHKVVKEPVTAEVWEKHLAGEVGLGMFPLRRGDTVRFACLDVDEYPLDHVALEQKIERLHLPLVICRSKSGGAHLYLFAAEDIPATNIRTHLLNWAAALGVKKYDLFPSANTLADNEVGNFINMPYFNQHRGTQHAVINGEDANLEKFLAYAAGRRSTLGDLDLLTIPEPELLTGGPPCLHALIRQNGSIGDHRNNALLSLGVYAKKRYTDEWEPHLDELNLAFIDPQLSSREVAGSHKSIAKKDYNYLCNKEPLVGFCDRQLCLTRPYGVRGEQDRQLDIHLGQLTKFTTDPPTWELEVEGTTIRLNTDELYVFAKFRKVFLEKKNRILPMIKQPRWEELVNGRLDHINEATAPEDASEAGLVKHHWEQWCLRRPARERAEMKNGKVWWDDKKNQVQFRMPYLKEYLNAHRVRITQNELASLLRSWGAEHGSTMLKGSFIQYWNLPAPVKPDETNEPTENRVP